MPTSSLAPVAVVAAINDDKVGIITTLVFQWQSIVHEIEYFGGLLEITFSSNILHSTDHGKTESVILLVNEVRAL